jgi:hypothetical protein
MFRCIRLAFLFLPICSGPAWCAVTVTSSVGGVQKGGSITFTAATNESDPVVKVTFTYEGTAGSDEVTSSPYVVTKTMNWTTMINLTVTATFDFQNLPDQQGSVDVNVVDILMTSNSTPTRGSWTNYIANARPAGISVGSWSWTYQNTTQNVYYTDTSDNDALSSWGGTIAISGTVTVQATIQGVNCTQSRTITVQPRTTSAWTTPVTCAEDNDPDWGVRLDGAQVMFSEHHDKDSDVGRIIVPQASEGDWSDAVTLAQIASGPNKDIWYVQSNVLEIDMETVINQFLKSGGPPPEQGATNFFDHNNASGGCIEDDMTDFVQACKNHEYRGTPPTAKSLEGHFGRIEYGLDYTEDPAAAVEPLMATLQSQLQTLIDTALESIENDLYYFCGEDDSWSQAGPNWGGTGSLGSGKHTRYDMGAHQYNSGCNDVPDHF